MATFLYVNDSLNNTWQFGVQDDGNISTSLVSPQTPAALLLNDADSGTTTWQLGVSISGNPTTSPVAFSGTAPFYYSLNSPSDLLWSIEVHSDGTLFTVFGPAVLPGFPCGVPGDVTIAAGATTLGVLPASGSQELFTTALYKYANLTLPYNPNDPGLSWQFDNSTLAPTVVLAARFFNLLNETSTPVLLNAGTVSISGASGLQLTDCLDVRLFGAKGDGVTDDTDAVQAALNQAAANYQALLASGITSSSTLVSGGILGPTIVCIPTGVYCLVTPRWDDLRDRSGAPVVNSGAVYSYTYYSSTSVFNGATNGGVGYVTYNDEEGNNSVFVPKTRPSIYYPGLACLLIDDGVTLLIDGGVIVGRSANPVTTLQISGSNVSADQFAYQNFYSFVWAIENKNAWIRGPFAGGTNTRDTIANSAPGPRTYEEWISGGLQFINAVDSFTGDGSTTQFTLSFSPEPGTVTVTDTNGTVDPSQYSVAGNILTFLTAPASGDAITVSYTYTQPGFELGPRNSNITITGEGFIDCGASTWNTYPTIALPAHLATNGIGLCKADGTLVSGITIRNFNTSAVYIGHSERVTVDAATIQDQKMLLQFTEILSSSIFLDAARKTSITNNSFLNLDNVLWDGLSRSTLFSHNKVQQCGSTVTSMFESFPATAQTNWQIYDTEFNFDITYSLNEITYNKSRTWTPNVTFEQDVVVSPSAAYTSPIAPGPAGFYDWYGQFVQNGGGWGGAGRTGSTEPDWDTTTTSSEIVEPNFTVTGELLGFGGRDFDGNLNQYFETYYNYDGASPTVYLNGNLQTLGTDYNIVTGFVFFIVAPGEGDVVTADYTGIGADWSCDNGAEAGQGPLTTVFLMQGFNTTNTFGLTEICKAVGVRVVHNTITDNDMDAIEFASLKNSSLSYNLILRNSNGINERFCPLSNWVGIAVACVSVDVIQNTVDFYVNYLSGQGAITSGIMVCPDDTGLTVDNPNVDPTTIQRQAATQNFYEQVNNEVPSGTADGSNTIFTLVNAPVSGTLQLYVNGILEDSTQYSVSGNTITFITAPSSGSNLLANYQWNPN